MTNTTLPFNNEEKEMLLDQDIQQVLSVIPQATFVRYFYQGRRDGDSSIALRTLLEMAKEHLYFMLQQQRDKQDKSYGGYKRYIKLLRSIKLIYRVASEL